MTESGKPEGEEQQQETYLRQSGRYTDDASDDVLATEILHEIFLGGVGLRFVWEFLMVLFKPVCA